VQYVPPDGTFQIDIVTRLGEAVAFRDLETERVAFDDLTVSVVTARSLYAMKRNTASRTAQALKERFGIPDTEER